MSIVTSKIFWIFLIRGLLPAAVILCVDQIVVNHLHGSIPDVVHPVHPQHLILGLEFLGEALTGGHLFYQLKEHIITPNTMTHRSPQKYLLRS